MLGNAIKELRKSRGLSLRKLAKKSNIAVSTLSEIERGVNGGRNPRVIYLIKLCKALEVTPNDLIPKEYWEK